MAHQINRRSFIRGASITALGVPLFPFDLLESSAIADSPPNPPQGPRSSIKRGAKSLLPSAFRETVSSISGIPLGGIGAGSVELRPDGYFYDWLIFNMGNWSPEQPDHEQGPPPEINLDGLQFFVRCRQGQAPPQLRRLGLQEGQNDLYSLSYALPVQAIDYEGKFPFVKLGYVDDSLPVEITGIAFAPIIPQDSQTSGTPGFTMAFNVKNVSTKPVDVSLMGALKNPLAWGAKDRALTNQVIHQTGTTTLSLTTQATQGRKSCHGSMALSVTGDRTSTLAGTYRWYLGNGGWGSSRGYGSAHYSYLHPYLRDGKLPSLSNESNLDDFLKDASDHDIDSLPMSELESLRARLQHDAFFSEFMGRIQLIQPELLTTASGLANLMKEARDRINSFSGNNRDQSTWGDVALESTVNLAPGEEREIRFAVSWFFPNHFSALGPNLGHQYEHWFADALAVNRFLVSHHGEHRKKTVNFAENMLTTNVDPAVSFAWGAQLTTLIKSSWWCKDGRFAIWEGLGCCGLHTTDITYQGSFPIIALFPDLQKGQIKMGAQYQRADGRIPHFFSPDLMHVDNGFDRVDMNPQYVMMVCRDYLWTGDLAFAKDNWPKVKRAMLSTQQLDGDGDGLPDRDTRRNTYDQWDLEGSPAYICSLWLGSLRAGIRLAQDLGEADQANQWTELLEMASKAFVGRLWNGEYFNLWVSENGEDECCMSDQLSGEWYTGLMGLGHSVSPEHLLAAAQSVYKYNFNPEHGLLNATYPPGKKPHFRTHQNLQAAGNWTGIEYANAALMMELGMVKNGVAIMQAVHDRYVRAGRRWNHVECGDHYFRAMSSWTSLLAITGLKLDVPKGSISLGPKVDGLVAPWFLPTGYGTLASSGRRLELVCRDGGIAFRELRLASQSATARVSLDGRSLALTSSTLNGECRVKFSNEVNVVAGQTLLVSTR